MGFLVTFLVGVLLAGSLALTSRPASGVAGFGDVGESEFYTRAVQWMVDNEITTGTSPTCFSPDDPVTRGQAAAFMWRMEGFEEAAPHPFTDVVAPWQQAPVAWMYHEAITTGTSPTTYSPDEPLTRGQLAALLWRLDRLPASSHPFTDVIAPWQQTPVGWMFAEGITTGTSPTAFSPAAYVTRGQLATFFWRYKGEPPVTVDSLHPANSCGPSGGGVREVLVFHKTAGFRHGSIAAGIEAVTNLGEEHGYAVTATDDAATFADSTLARYDVVVFLNTTGDVLDRAHEQALERFIQAGNGFVGIHSASDTEYHWPWYEGLIGAYFDDHPSPQPATIHVQDSGHPTMRGLPPSFERVDEWYNFASPLLADVTILATVDEGSYEGGNMGAVHPVIWAQEYGGGRSFYTGFGHTAESFEEPVVLTLLGNAINWAADSN